MSSINDKLTKVGMPNLVFMFTVDQIASMLNISEDSVISTYLYFQGRTTGMKKKHHMFAVNIAPDSSEKAMWRVSLEEFRKWLSRMGFKQSDMTRL